MRNLTTALAAVMATLLFAACAKKEEAPAAEAPAEQAAPVEAAPADAAPADGAATDGTGDAEQSGGDKVSEPEPAPSGG